MTPSVFRLPPFSRAARDGATRALPLVPGQRTTGPDDAPVVPAAPAPGPSCTAPAVWLVNVAEEADGAAALAAGVLDAGERKRAAAFVRESDRRCYVAAHVALRTLLGAAIGVSPGAVRLVREDCPTCGGPHGRPAVAGGPHFSLSHSGDLALIALAPVTVGADVERTPSRETAARTARMLHPDEIAELEALDAAALDENAEDEAALPAAAPDGAAPGAPAALPEAFGRAWVRKEAYLKALGTGLSRSTALDYLGTTPAPARSPDGWTVTDVRVPGGYLAAVATREE